LDELQSIIEDAFETRAQLSPRTAPRALRGAVASTIGILDEKKKWNE